MAHHRNYHLYSRRKKAFFDPDEIKPWTFYSWQKYFAIAQLRDLGFLNCFFSSTCLSWKCLGTEMHFYIEVMLAAGVWVDCVGESWNGRRRKRDWDLRTKYTCPWQRARGARGDRIFMKVSIIQKGDSFVLFFCSSNIFSCNLGFENISIYNGKKISHTAFARPIACARKTNY